jgi:hypothetical protein
MYICVIENLEVRETCASLWADAMLNAESLAVRALVAVAFANHDILVVLVTPISHMLGFHTV